MHYYPHNIGDYASATMHLSILEDGVYRRLLDLYYLHEKPLPGDKRQVCRLVRAASKPEQAAVDAVLAEFFILHPDGCFHHKRCDAEIAKAHAKSEKARNSAAQRWHSEGSANAHANASEVAMRTHSEGNAPNNQETITNKRTRKRVRSIPDDFGISDRVRQWAEGHGHDRLELRLDHFVGWAKAGGKAYVDWEQAFMNAIRDNWAKLPPAEPGLRRVAL